MLNKEQHALLIFLEQRRVCRIETVMEPSDKCLFLLFIRIVRFQEQGAQCRTQRQCVDRRQTDSDSQSQTKLAVESTRGPRHEAHGDEHGHHHQSN